MASSTLRLAAAATATAFLLAGGGAAHAGGTDPDDAAVTAQPGDGEDDPTDPDQPTEGEDDPTDPDEPTDGGDTGEEDPTDGGDGTDGGETDGGETDDGGEEVEVPAGEWLDPGLWAWLLQEDGVVDAACFLAELPAPGEYFVADQEYLLVLDLMNIWDEETLEIYAYGSAVEDPVLAGDAIEVGTDPENDALILCTGTLPADWDGELPVEEVPTTGGGTGGGAPVGGSKDDGGTVIGPVVQTDRPAPQGEGALTGGLALAAAAALGLLGLRRRAQV